MSCDPAMQSLNKQHVERQSTVTIRSRYVHNYLRADKDFQGVVVTDSLLWWYLHLLIITNCRVLNTLE